MVNIKLLTSTKYCMRCTKRLEFHRVKMDQMETGCVQWNRNLVSSLIRNGVSMFCRRAWTGAYLTVTLNRNQILSTRIVVEWHRQPSVCVWFVRSQSRRRAANELREIRRCTFAERFHTAFNV